jgi:hypothetical protein
LPSKEDHRGKAEHDEFFVSNVGNPFFDWQISGVFYSALHYVDAYFATLNIHPRTHAERTTFVNLKLKPVYIDYRELLNESREARYEPASIFNQDDVTRVQRSLDAIKKAVLPHI